MRKHRSVTRAITEEERSVLDGKPHSRTISKDSPVPFDAPHRFVDCAEEHMPLIDNRPRDRVRELNDAFRKSLNPALGRAVLTVGVNALPDNVRALAIENVAAFDAFTADNDPHGEHDFGSFELAGERYFWKIDYYDRNLEYGSDDPADPSKTTRVLTLILAAEY